MAEITLSQADAETLIEMPKSRVDNTVWNFPQPGHSISIPLKAVNHREDFLLDVWVGRIAVFSKGTYQNRARLAIVLVRLDFGGPPHRNPDGEEVACPHLHVYRQDFGDKWACPLPNDKFYHTSDPWSMLHDFMRYCSIVEPPSFQRGIFL
ncbi:MAG: hypothetical protein HQK59_01140 [Deltaproteobacteria bacterium]|nr:hypothetical protein [Deltaproteobacteria bacterium]